MEYKLIKCSEDDMPKKVVKRGTAGASVMEFIESGSEAAYVEFGDEYEAASFAKLARSWSYKNARDVLVRKRDARVYFLRRH